MTMDVLLFRYGMYFDTYECFHQASRLPSIRTLYLMTSKTFGIHQDDDVVDDDDDEKEKKHIKNMKAFFVFVLQE